MSLGFTTTYDPALMLFTVIGNLIDGYMDGTFITVEQDEDDFMLKVGADGETARARNQNRAGKIIVQLMQSSPSNDVLATLNRLDKTIGAGIGPSAVRDGLGNSVATCPDSFIARPAKIERGKEILGTEWTIICPHLDVFVGGAIQVPV